MNFVEEFGDDPPRFFSFVDGMSDANRAAHIFWGGGLSDGTGLMEVDCSALPLVDVSPRSAATIELVEGFDPAGPPRPDAPKGWEAHDIPGGFRIFIPDLDIPPGWLLWEFRRDDRREFLVVPPGTRAASPHPFRHNCVKDLGGGAFLIGPISLSSTDLFAPRRDEDYGPSPLRDLLTEEVMREAFNAWEIVGIPQWLQDERKIFPEESH